MDKTAKVCSNLFIMFISLETLLYFLNTDMYFQLSGFNVILLMGLFFGVIASIQRCMVVTREKIALIIFIVGIILSILVNKENIERGYVLSYLVLAIFSFLIFSIKLNQKQINFIIISYISLAVIISFLIILLRVRFYENDGTRLTIKIGDNPLIDPNYLGSVLVAPLIFSFKSLIENKGKKIRVLYVLICISILLGLLLTGSRGSLIAIIISAIIILFKIVFLNNNASRFIKILILIFIGCVLALAFIDASVLERLFSFSTWIDASNLRRFELWDNAFNAILENPILGYGIASTASTIGASAHNTFLEVWLQLGIFGIASFAFIIISPISRKNDVYVKAVIISTIVFSIFISAEMCFTVWLNVILGVIIPQNKEGDNLCEIGKCDSTCLQR